MRIARVAAVLCALASPCHASDHYTDLLDDAGVPQFPDTAQHSITARPLPAWYECITNVPRDIIRFGSASFNEGGIPAYAGITAMTLGLVATDHYTNEFSSGIYGRSRTVASISDFFVSVGDGKTSLLMAGAFGLYGYVGSDARALRTASQTVEALIATGFVIQTIKHIAGRESPSVATSDRGTWRPFPSFRAYHQHQSKYHAFPSGHIATTMAAMTVCIENYSEVGWLKPVGYSIVGLVGVGLADKGWHWYSDFPLGLAIGYTFGRCIARPEQNPDIGLANGSKLSILPIVGRYANGMRVSLHL